MKKYFVSADIHGYFTLWQKALARAGFSLDNPEHIVVVLGDLMDRGTESLAVVDFLLSLPPERTVLVVGNHEDLLEQLISRGRVMEHDEHNGTDVTLSELAASADCDEKIKDKYERARKHKYWELRKRMKNYAEIGEYVLVHGWIPCKENDFREYCETGKTYVYVPDWRDATEAEWRAARWLNGMMAWADGVRVPEKTVICGHYHCSYGNSRLHRDGDDFGPTADFTPFEDDGIIAIDACTSYSGMVNVVVIYDE